MRFAIICTILMLFAPVAASVAHAETAGIDLILPPSLESPDAPFYRGAKVKMGDTILPVREVALPSGVLAEFRPEQNAILVSNTADRNDTDKAAALMDVLSALEAGAIATAAGQE
jgi:hypothetical protein